MRRAFDPTLCLVVGPRDTPGRDPVAVAEAAIAGGATMVQLRWKAAPPAEAAALARRLLAVCRPAGVALVVNDDAALAAAVGADGVHVGQSDLAPAAARARVGPEAILGLSVENLAQAGCVAAGVDYVGIGPVWATPSKTDAAPPLGLAGFAAVRAALALPAMAIGGVGAANAGALRRAGADGLAVISAIAGADDPAAAARVLRQAFRE
mgnify:FL=1